MPTANETAKWEDVHDSMANDKELVVRYPKGGLTPSHFAESAARAAASSDGLRERKGRKEEARPGTPADEAIGDMDIEWETRTIKSYDDIQSIYNRGWWGNLMEVLFPL